LKMKVVHGAFMNSVMPYGKIIPQIMRQTRTNVALHTSLTLECYSKGCLTVDNDDNKCLYLGKWQYSRH
jgi:hypothetical protein